LTRSAFAALLALLAGAAPAAAAPHRADVNVQYSAYGPSQLDVLPGTRVRWSNESTRTHTVTAYDGTFDSGRLEPGARFQVTFTRPGTYQYHCSIHPSIVGEIDVRRVIFDTLPTAAVPVGTMVDFSGVTGDAGKPVRIERRAAGSRFTTVARTTAGQTGAWHVRIRATGTGDYRATSAGGASEVRRLLVAARKIHIRATRTGVAVDVTPSAPYAPILLEIYLRERFGWWPVAHCRLDYVSEADLHVPRGVRVRVVLVDRDGWTPLATSREVMLGRR
jgi:plastocyanin